MKKRAILLLGLIVTVTAIKAQFMVPNEKKAKAVSGRTLIVRLDEPDYQLLRKYRKDPKKTAKYKADVEKHNELLMSCIKKYWQLNEHVVFETGLKADDKARADKTGKYVVLYGEDDYEVTRTTKRVIKHACYKVKLRLGENNKPLFSVSLPSDALTQVDYKFICRQFDKYVTAGAQGISTKKMWDVEGNLRIMAQKTLVLPKNIMALSEREAREVYPRELSYVEDMKVIDKRILAGDDDFIFLTLIWSYIKDNYLFAAVDASTMDIVALLGTGSFNLSFSVPIDAALVDVWSYRSALKLKEKHLKYLSSRKAMEKNNHCMF
ncbi:hypothetical protein DMA11_23605 [Marinilabiliaceae bacterium JC017]|nr:hypothetical protein DMA11_23605 [Marinilabiliaceae bacterium JC017]